MMSDNDPYNPLQGCFSILVLIGVLWGFITYIKEDNSYTLYRTSLVEGINRVYIASFDSSEGEKFNFESCVYTKELYENQPYIRTKFWCEKGRYKK